MPSANELQVGGTHYKTPYQHWDYTADVLEGRYMEGQIAKYISRARKKNGVADYEKAAHFVMKLMEQNPTPPKHDPADYEATITFANVNELTELETFALCTLAMWEGPQDLGTVFSAIDFMKRAYELQLATAEQETGAAKRKVKK